MHLMSRSNFGRDLINGCHKLVVSDGEAHSLAMNHKLPSGLLALNYELIILVYL